MSVARHFIVDQQVKALDEKKANVANWGPAEKFFKH
jgi:hypothetical protein